MLKPLLIVSLASLVFTGCIIEDRRPRRTVVVHSPAPPPAPVVTEVIVPGPPPPPPSEVVVVAPGPGYIWLPGVWAWSGRWVWEAGHWGRPPHAGAVWVPHHYYPRGGVHVWVRGGWR